MAGNSVVHIGENSAEQIAYKLMEHVSRVEGVVLYKSKDEKVADRKWILDTYAECLLAVQNPAARRG